MRETGIVKSVDGETCICAVKRKSACGENCASCKAACSSREHTFSAKNLAGAQAGDTVIIEMGTKKVLASAFLVYIVPLVAFLLGLSYFFETGKSELVSVFWGLVLGSAAWILVSFYGRWRKEELVPEIVEIVTKNT
ncbi:MAG: SoxR reducing system RseC family protein [Clostridia bacterium]|nr:SoxR reducing system RseC family protein [Clostridia bacterium]